MSTTSTTNDGRFFALGCGLPFLLFLFLTMIGAIVEIITTSTPQWFATTYGYIIWGIFAYVFLAYHLLGHHLAENPARAKHHLRIALASWIAYLISHGVVRYVPSLDWLVVLTAINAGLNGLLRSVLGPLSGQDTESSVYQECDAHPRYIVHRGWVQGDHWGHWQGW